MLTTNWREPEKIAPLEETWPETTITQLAQMMGVAHIHRVIIVDDQRRPLGIVSSTDIVAAVARNGEDEESVF